MKPIRTYKPSRSVLAAAVTVVLASVGPSVDAVDARRDAAFDFDPLLSDPGRGCSAAFVGQPGVLPALLLAAAQAPVPSTPAAADPPLYPGLGSLNFAISTRQPKAQAYFDQGLRLAFAFNHAESRRAFQAAQRIDPDCAMCYWGEALVLGPNINVPMMPESVEPALAALAAAVARKGNSSEREQVLIEALQQRYSADPKAERAALDAAYADAMRAAARRFPSDDTVLALYAEAAMDTQPWDYWEGGGTRPKGRGADILEALLKVLARNPKHIGAIHLYIHAVEASTDPDRALPYADRLAALAPAAGHLVHMPAHIYYRVGKYRDSLTLNQRAVQVDEAYFKTSPSDAIYRAAYYPHNIHFVLVSAQLGGAATTAIDAAAKLDAALPLDVVRAFAVLQPLKAAPYAAHAQFSDAQTVLALPAPSPDLAWVGAMYHYARAVALAQRKDTALARAEIEALATLESATDFKPFDEWQAPARQVMQIARLVATARLADAEGDLDAAAKAYASAIAIEDTLPYTEPPYWYYPVRQSLAALQLRQGKLPEAQATFRESLGRVRNNGWALAGLAEVERRKGDAGAERIARQAFVRAWFGPASGPDLARL